GSPQTGVDQDSAHFSFPRGYGEDWATKSYELGDLAREGCPRSRVSIQLRQHHGSMSFPDLFPNPASRLPSQDLNVDSVPSPYVKNRFEFRWGGADDTKFDITDE